MAVAPSRRVIIDCDPGVDDAQAIIMLLTQKDIQVVAITTVFGNEPIENTTRNAVRVLKLLNRLDIPVYKGCACPLTVDWPQTCLHDRLGKSVIPDVDPVDISCIQPEHASIALCRLVSKDAGSITLLSTGPLTNIAVALMLDASFGSKLKDCVMMGGNYVGRVDTSPAAAVDHNWRCDPEAAHAVLAGLNRVVTLLPKEICVKSPLSWEVYERITGFSNKVAQFIKTVNKHLNQSGKCLTRDQLAAASVINAAVVLETENVCASVELHCAESRGLMMVDFNNTQGKMANVCVVTKVDQALYENLMTSAFSIW